MSRRKPDEFLDTLSALASCLRSVAARRYSTIQLGATQAKFLRAIGRERGISQADLARATETDPTLTGRALAPLVDRGWVRRKRSEADRREYVLELTALGRRACKQVEAVRSRIAAHAVGALDARDIDDFDRIAKKLLTAFAGA